MQLVMDEEIDKKIISLCNQLIEVKHETSNLKRSNELEQSKLRRCLEQKRQRLTKLKKKYRAPRDLHVYKDAIKTAYQGVDVIIPPFASTRQAQLCHHVHVMTVEENQFILEKRQCGEQRKELQNTIRRMQEEFASIQFQYLNEICVLEKEMQDVSRNIAAEVGVVTEDYHKSIDMSVVSAASGETEDTNSDGSFDQMIEEDTTPKILLYK